MPNPPGPSLDESRTVGDSAADHVSDHNVMAELLNNFEISDAVDVDIDTTPPSTGQGLIWDGSKFVPGSVGSTAGVATHGGLTGVTANQHHAKSHIHDGSDGSGTVLHADITSVGTDDHHAQAHTVASHSDTSGTGTELNTLTDGSNADALHVHTTIGSASMDDLTDADTTTNAPAAGDLFFFNGTNWVPIDMSALVGSTALPTAVVAGVTTGHVAHTNKLNEMFNTILGVTT